MAVIRINNPKDGTSIAFSTHSIVAMERKGKKISVKFVHTWRWGSFNFDTEQEAINSFDKIIAMAWGDPVPLVDIQNLGGTNH